MIDALPTVGVALDGCDGYVDSLDLPAHGIQRRWLWRGAPQSVQWRTGGVVKCWDKFPEHQTVETMDALLRECRARGVERPSSYGALFHARHQQPFTSRALLKIFPRGLGGWEALYDGHANPARGAVTVQEPVWEYDLRSAYLWALAQGLPHPDTFRAVRRFAGPGIYWYPSPAWDSLPYPWNQRGLFPVTSDELERIAWLHPRHCLRGIAFTPETFSTGPWVTDMQQWSCWKAVARAYWGRWIAGTALRQQTFRDGVVSSDRVMPDQCRNPVWGLLITSRVRLRLWDVAQHGGAYRVYVDAVTLNRELPTGPNLGDWALKRSYPRGAYVGMNQTRERAA